MALKDYHIGRERGPAWPLDDSGEAVEPVFLEHVSGRLETDMEINLLRAYDIPVLYRLPNNGELAEVVMGFAPTGTDLYVPATMVDDARNLLSTDLSAQAEEGYEELSEGEDNNEEVQR